MLKHYINSDGGYVGGFDREPDNVESLILVPPPEHAAQRWNFETNEWLPVPDPVLADAARAERDARIQAMAWRFERYARDIRMGRVPRDDVAVLDAYVDALCDVPEQSGFPQSINWPEQP